MQTTLQLLQGPTRLLVGSALTGLAAELVLNSSRPAHCYVFKPNYDDETFQSIYGPSTQRALASSKPKRAVGVVALKKLTAPSNLAVIVGRNVGLATLVTVNRWLVAALEEEDAADAEGREPEMPQLSVQELQAAGARGVYNACVDVAVQATRAGLDAAAAEHLQPQLAKRLIKDLRLSAVRKGRLPWFLRAPRVARTALYSEATLWAADFLVSSALEARLLLLKSSGALGTRLRRLALRCGLHAVRAAVVLAAVALGNGVGSASPRFRGLAMWLGSLGASFAANGYMLALMNRWAPAGGGGGGATRGGSAAPAAGGPPSPPPGPQQGQPAAPGAAPGGGFLLVGQAVHPDARAAAAAAAGGGGDPDAGAPDPNGPPAQPGGPGAAAQPDMAAGVQADGMRQDAGVQAGAPEADEPPIPAPQQRRVVGGPRLPERPARRHAAAGPDQPADPAAPALAGQPVPLAPPPAAPATPQFRLDQRAPTPAGDSEEAEARAAAAAALAASGSPAAAATVPA